MAEWRQLAAPASRVQPTMALEPRVPLGTWACVTPLRGVAPFRQGSDRPRMGPPGRRAAAVGAAPGASLRVVHLAAVAAVRRPGCVAAAVELDPLRDLPPVPPAPRGMGEVAATSGGGGGGKLRSSSWAGSTRGTRRGGAGGIGGPAGSGCNGQEPFDGASGSGMTRGKVSPAIGGRADARRVQPALPARCLLQRRRRSVHRSSKDARHCRGEQE